MLGWLLEKPIAFGSANTLRCLPLESHLPLKPCFALQPFQFKGNCDSQGKLGMCPSLAEPDSGGFPKNISHCNCSTGTVARLLFVAYNWRISLLGKTVFHIRQKGVPPLLLPASMLQLPRCLGRICNLFHINHKITNLTVSKNAIAAGKTNCEIQFAPQMWATRPHLGSIFEKLLHRKTF